MTKMQVPCGHCAACVANKQQQLLQRAQLEFEDCHVVFVTLTYKDKFLPTLDVNGFKHHYADDSDVRRLLKSIRHYGNLPPFKQLFISEYGGFTHRPHWHGLFFFDKDVCRAAGFTPSMLACRLTDLLKRYWVYCSKGGRYPVYEQMLDFNAVRYNNGVIEKPWDCHYVTDFSNRFDDVTSGSYTDSDKCSVSFYVTKYMLKSDDWIKRKQQALRLNLDDREYYDIWTRTLRPKVLLSHKFGQSRTAFETIDSMLKDQDRPGIGKEYVQFYLHGTKDGHDNSHWFPMSRYLRSIVLKSVDEDGFPDDNGKVVYNTKSLIDPGYILSLQKYRNESAHYEPDSLRYF